jgi:DNA/RNA endonuclease YhcR with UshA esterase domain
MSQDQPQNTTAYVHPRDPNLNRLESVMEYSDGIQPHLRVSLGSDNITVTGSVNIASEIKINNTDGQSIPVHLTDDPIAVTGTFWQATQPVSIATMPTTAVTIASMPTTPVTGTFWQATQPVSITTLPEVEIKNDAGNPITVTGSVTTIGGSAQGKLWTMQIAQGLIAGHTVEQVTGYNPSTSAGDAVWSGGTAYPWSSFNTAQTLYLKSSTNNATDRSMSILIDGLDSNYANQTEVITLNASDSRTAVVSTKQFLRIHNVQCNGADTNVGDIITTVTSGTGTIVSKISAGRGSARAGAFTIPAGYTGYLFKGDASSTAATVVNFMARYFGKAFMVIHVAIVDNSTYIYDFPFPMALPEKTDMYCSIEAGSGKTAVNYEILLVAN